METINFIDVSKIVKESIEKKSTYIDLIETTKENKDIEKELLDDYKNLLEKMELREKFKLILNTVGISFSKNNLFTMLIELTKLLPYIEKNYNLLLIGEKSLGKSSTYTKVLPFVEIIAGIPTEAYLRGGERTGTTPGILKKDILLFEEIADKKETSGSISLLKTFLSSGKFKNNNKDEEKSNASIIMNSNEYSKFKSFEELKKKDIFDVLPSGVKDEAFLSRFNGILLFYNNLLNRREYTTSNKGIHTQQFYNILKSLKEISNNHLKNLIEYKTRSDENMFKTIEGFVKLFYLDKKPDDYFIKFIKEWAKFIVMLSEKSTTEVYYPFSNDSVEFISKLFFPDRKIEYVVFLNHSRLLFKFTESDENGNSKILSLDGFGVNDNLYDLNFIKGEKFESKYCYSLKEEGPYLLNLTLEGDVFSSKKIVLNKNKENFNNDDEYNNLLLDLIENMAILDKNNPINIEYEFRGTPKFYENIIKQKAKSIFDRSDINKNCYTQQNGKFKFFNYKTIMK